MRITKATSLRSQAPTRTIDRSSTPASTNPPNARRRAFSRASDAVGEGFDIFPFETDQGALDVALRLASDGRQTLDLRQSDCDFALSAAITASFPSCQTAILHGINNPAPRSIARVRSASMGLQISSTQ